MQRVSDIGFAPLHTISQTKALESALAATLPPHTLMRRAGHSVARLARSLAPHARNIWIACGPGNNGGDGLMAACFLAPWTQETGANLCVTHIGMESNLSADARYALASARASGAVFSDAPPPECDLVIDAVLGLGGRGNRSNSNRPEAAERLLELVHATGGIRLCVDVPSGIDSDTGINYVAKLPISACHRSIYTLTFLTLKPGLFTAHGRDSAGEVWFDDLGASSPWGSHQSVSVGAAEMEDAQLGTASLFKGEEQGYRPHASHKGSRGDVWVVGGQHASHNGSGMTGAAILAGCAALQTGAGRVFVVPLGEPMVAWDPSQAELMFRSVNSLDNAGTLSSGCWVCGCGGGELVADQLGKLLQGAHRLILDADALNALTRDPALAEVAKLRKHRGLLTVLTPHPLEAARLQGSTTQAVQENRLACARDLANIFGAFCVLKGSGTVIAGPNGKVIVNSSGNGRLATAGTGDVLAGMLGATMAKHALPLTNSSENCLSTAYDSLLLALAGAVWRHGQAADLWRNDAPTLTASNLCLAIGPVR